MAWKDISNYSQSDKNRTPWNWELEFLPNCRIIVHKHIHNPEKWHLTCQALQINTKELREDSIELAKREALKIVKFKAEQIANYVAVELEKS